MGQFGHYYIKIKSDMIHLKHALISIVKLPKLQHEKSKSEIKKVIEIVKIPHIPKAKGLSHIRDRRRAFRNISLIPDYLFKRFFRLD